MAETEFVYEESIGGGRFIILNDLNQEVPKGELRVVGASERVNGYGKKYPVLELEEEATGAAYFVAAWPRDVRLCIKEHGTKPTNWGNVLIKRGPTRYEIVPAQMHAKEERVE